MLRNSFAEGEKEKKTDLQLTAHFQPSVEQPYGYYSFHLCTRRTDSPKYWFESPTVTLPASKYSRHAFWEPLGVDDL